MRKLPMSAAEIATSYRTAKNQQMQIGILADLNLCSKEEMREVLVQLGALEPARTRLHDGTMDKALTAWPQEKFGDGGTVQLTRQMADLYEAGGNDAEI